MSVGGVGFPPEAIGLWVSASGALRLAFREVQEVSSVMNAQSSNGIGEFLVKFLATAQVSGYLKQQLLTSSKPTSEGGAIWKWLN